MELTMCLVAVLLGLLLFWWLRPTPGNLPPFPRKPLPGLGNLLSMRRDSRRQFEEWRRQSGDIFSLYMGGTLVVVLNGFDLIKEALVKKGDVFSHRPPYFANDALGMSNAGIILATGQNWKEQRSVSLAILKSFGMGKNILAEQIQEEVGHYMDYLRGLKGKPTDIHVMTNVSTSNIICSILIGHRFEYEDKKFQALLEKLSEFVRVQENVSIINFFYWLQHLPGDLFNAKKLTCLIQDILQHLMEFVREKTRTELEINQADNFIDAYILEKNKKIAAGVSTELDEANLSKTMLDLFIAGSETTSTTINWFLLYMIHYPQVQEKIFQEMKENIGTERLPSMHDRIKLVYLNAAIMETQRLASILPLSVAHMTSEETELLGYTIPKETYILPNLDSVLHDKSSWGDDVMSFRPERFLDDKNQLLTPEHFVPFGLGRRVCLGESMARMELYLYLAHLLHHFKVSPANPASPPPLSYQSGIINTPRSYELRLAERT